MAKSKKQQNSLMKEQPSSSIDRISSLPDSVICHILSFLPTKYTVATSILSKRWKPLWFSVFTLEFFDKRDTSGPFSHIYSVLQSRDIKLPIRSFHLKLPRYCYCKSDDITQLVTAVIHRQTQNLELNLQYNTFDVKLASNIFTCRTLVVLKLRGLWMMDQIPQINNNISKLKTLHLHKALFKSTTHVIDFLLSFPMLEELQTNYVHVIDEIAPKTEDKLKYLPNLVTAKVYDTSTESIPCFLLSRARSLSVKLPWTFDQLPIFYNLNQLELMIDKNRKWVWTWVWMQDMLQHTPKLQHLIIHQEIGNETENVNDDDDIWKDPKIVLECLSSQLKTCLFKNYRGKKWELLFAEYVMSNSKVLSNMTIHCACSIDLDAKCQMLEKLSVCPRGCRLIFK